MTLNVPVKAASAGEKVKLRSENQFSKLGLYIQLPATVYTMRVNQTFDSLDRVASLIYDGGSGTYTNAFAGMTVLVSGVAYGKHDKGICRLRKVLPSATTGEMSINETSDIRFADNDYITIIKSFSIWQKDITVDGGVVKMDYDIEFGSFMNGGMQARIGPECAVLFRTAGTVNFTPVSPALSAAYDGATKVSHLYVCPTASAVLNPTTDTPTFTFTTAGEHLYWIEITDSLGRVTKSYRWVFVDPVPEEFRLLDWDTDAESGGVSYKVRCYTDISNIYDRAMVVLYTTHESYGGVTGAIGKLAGFENIKGIGWIDGKTIFTNAVEGYVEFEVKDASYWLSKIRAFPFGLMDTADLPTDWVHLQNLNVDKALAHLLFWTSTAPLMMDCFLTGSTIRTRFLESPADNLWEQIQNISFSTIHASPRVNTFGQLFIEIDSQYLSSADQAAVVVVQHLEKNDYQGGLEINIEKTTRVSMLELSGLTAWDGSASPPVFSRAPGSIGATFGVPDAPDNYLFESQAECDRLAGVRYALANNIYEPITLELGAQNDFFDIAPRQFATITVLAADNPLGVALTTVRMIPRSIKRSYDTEVGFLSSMVTFEFLIVDVATVVDGLEYTPAIPLENNLPDYTLDIPGLNNVDFPSAALGSWFPPSIPSFTFPPGCNGSYHNVFPTSWDKAEIRGDDADRIARIYFPCKIRSTAALEETYIVLAARNNIPNVFKKDAQANTAVYAVSGGVRVLTATVGTDLFGRIVASFSTLTEIDVDGFELELAAGLGASVDFTPMNIIASGTLNATAMHRTNITIPENSYLSLEDVGGPWYWNYAPGGPEAGYGAFLWAADSYAGPGDGTLLVARDLSGAIDLYTEYTDANHTRVYFFSGAYTNVWVFTSDGMYTDNNTTNSGSIGYAIRNARVEGRRIVLGQSIINNVCEVG